MNDCIRVSEADVEGCPRDCGTFLVETTEKTFVFCVETAELEDWIQKLCEIAFPVFKTAFENIFIFSCFGILWHNALLAGFAQGLRKSYI